MIKNVFLFFSNGSVKCHFNVNFWSAPKPADVVDLTIKPMEITIGNKTFAITVNKEELTNRIMHDLLRGKYVYSLSLLEQLT